MAELIDLQKLPIKSAPGAKDRMVMIDTETHEMILSLPGEGGGGGGGSITVDSELDIQSTNPIQNKAVAEKLAQLESEKVSYGLIYGFYSPRGYEYTKARVTMDKRAVGEFSSIEANVGYKISGVTAFDSNLKILNTKYYADTVKNTFFIDELEDNACFFALTFMKSNGENINITDDIVKNIIFSVSDVRDKQLQILSETLVPQVVQGYYTSTGFSRINTRVTIEKKRIDTIESIEVEDGYTITGVAVFDKDENLLITKNFSQSLFETSSVSDILKSVFFAIFIEKGDGKSPISINEKFIKSIKKKKAESSGGDGNKDSINLFELEEVLRRNGFYNISGTFISSNKRLNIKYKIPDGNVYDYALFTTKAGGTSGFVFLTRDAQENILDKVIPEIQGEIFSKKVVKISRKTKFIEVVGDCSNGYNKIYAGISPIFSLPEGGRNTYSKRLFTKLTKPYIWGKSCVWFGASSTSGIMSRPDSSLVKTENCYAKIISDKLGLTQYKNFAVSGTTIYNPTVDSTSMLDRVLNYEGDEDTIFFHGGINDYIKQSPLGKLSDSERTSFCGCFKMICEKFKQLKEQKPSRNIIIFEPQNICAKPQVELVHDYNEYREKMGQLAAFYGFTIIAGDAIEMPSEYGEWQEIMEADGAHPTQQAHIYLGEGYTSLFL